MKINKNIYARAVASLKKHHVIYEKTDGKIYKSFKIAYYLLVSVTLFMTFAYLFGNILRYTSSPENSKLLMEKFMPNVYLFGGASIVLIAGIVFAAFKKDLVALILTVCPIIAKLIAYVPQMRNVALEETGLHQNYFWRHALPGVACIICICAFTAISLKARSIEKRAYKNLLDTLYKQNKDFTTLGEDKWNEFLDNYDPRKIEEERIRAKKEKGYTPIFSEDNKNKE